MNTAYFRLKAGLLAATLTLCLPLISFALAPFAAYAQTSAPTQGLSISPFLLERQMTKGQTSNEIIDITNTSNVTLPVIVTINDFYPVGENGEEQFVDSGQGNPRYSISKWITIQSNPKPVLGPNEKTSLVFSITAPPDAEDGGHYGALLFSFAPSQVEGSAVAVAQKLGAIILVKLGKASESGQITKFGALKSFYEYPPVNFVTRFKNTGNVHVAPRGSIQITNMFGREIANVPVNPNANNVLPESEREFTSIWKDTFGFGLYHASLNLAYGDTGQVEITSTNFWVIPWRITLAVAVVLFLLILLLVSGIRKYNKWLIKQAYALQKKS